LREWLEDFLILAMPPTGWAAGVQIPSQDLLPHKANVEIVFPTTSVVGGNGTFL
jgi:hypothetical protein